MIIHHFSAIGKRETNEDEHIIFLNLDGKTYPKLAHVNLFCVFDGHGGKEVSTYLAKKILKYILKQTSFPLSDKYINSMSDRLQQKIIHDLKNKALHVGSTALIAIQYMKDGRLWLQVINTGDSRSIISSNGVGIALSTDAKPGSKEEKKRIQSLGGKLEFDGFDFRIEGISVSRSYGDMIAYPYITHRPTCQTKMLTSTDQFFILACDGLWDVVSTQEAVNYVLSFYDSSSGKLRPKDKRKNVAKALVDLALKKKSKDNLTIIVAML